jgi:hypothetical protein
MPKEMSREERAEYQRNYRKAKAEEPNPKNTIADKGDGVYGLAWDGVIGRMSQQERDRILKAITSKPRG